MQKIVSFFSILIVVFSPSYVFSQFEDSSSFDCAKKWSKACDSYIDKKYSDAISQLWQAIECDKRLHPVQQNRKYPSAYSLLVECYEQNKNQDSAAYVRQLALEDSISVSSEIANQFKNIFNEPPSIIGGFESIKKYLIYPQKAKKDGIQGKAILRVIVDKTGKVTSINIEKEDGNNGFGQAASDCVKQLKFVPAKYNGTPVECTITIPIVFKLK